MKTHTPGPWTYEPEELGLSGAITAKTGWICDFDTDPFPANARLIAAAPELLNAVRFLLSNPDNRISNADRNAARVAIAKATGEEA